MTIPGPIAPLALLLGHVADELDGARRAILAAERHVAAVLRGEADPDGLTRDVQGIDLTLQVLDDLQGFLRRLGETLPETPVDAGPALSGLALGRLAATLARPAGAAVPYAPPHPSIELF